MKKILWSGWVEWYSREDNPGQLRSNSIYHMSMYLLPKTVTDRLDKQRRILLWQGIPKENIGWSHGKRYVKVRTKGIGDKRYQKDKYKSTMQMVVEV
jgi:hypothetical protein